MKVMGFAEYIWVDGACPVRQVRSKARALALDEKNLAIESFPEWSFDGSSTSQATGDHSDCILKPVNFVKDPLRGEGHYLVMCEVFHENGMAHDSNSRAQLRQVLEAGALKFDPWIGFEQEYTLFQENHPLGWPRHGYPAPQGPYYCGVGTGRVFGRDLVEEHAEMCLQAGIMIYGINAEVMPGQWEFQIGYRGIAGENTDILNTCDHVWFARWLLHRLSEEYDIQVSFDNKPMKGDWNGAGMHTNISTRETRDPVQGREAIQEAVRRLGSKHKEHIALYGDRLEERLTGHHETCSIHEFRSGAADRGSSIRIPQQVETKGYGYLEDRRPGANADPYLVAARICTTICGIDESVMVFTSWPRTPVRLVAAS